MIAPVLPATSSAPTADAKANPKLATAAKQFETVLLSQWLQDAQSSFASVPGGDSDTDSGGEQMQGFATQQLATSFTEHGGVGIAKLVLGALTKANDQEHGGASEVSAHPLPGASAAVSNALAAYKPEVLR